MWQQRSQSKVLSCGPRTGAREAGCNGQACEIWGVSGGDRYHSGRSNRGVDGGAGQRKSFHLQLGHEKSHIENQVIIEPNLEDCEGVSPVGIWRQSIVASGNKCVKALLWGWLCKQEQKASVAGIECKGKITVEETTDLTGNLFNENT